MIYSPHKDAEHRVAGSEHLHLLLDEVFLFGLGFSGQHEYGAGGAAGVTDSRHHAASPLLSSSQFLLSASAVTQSPQQTNTHSLIQNVFISLFRLFLCPKSLCFSTQITEIAPPHSRKRRRLTGERENRLQLANFCGGSPGGVITQLLEGQLREPIGGAGVTPRDLINRKYVGTKPIARI